ncbi:unnamed protein product [Prunus armeniaca]|uniref:F-box domain-containing protein n=1 Tax=Prunus armeniaca TaxID=36596 RepID=A0A6J5VA22_PRUAR|nr:unnamed protein product [Prunus armeniaca]
MDIPDLAWFKVLLLVAKHSSEDLYSMTGTCKFFEEMLNDPEVWRTVFVEKYQWHLEWAYGILLHCWLARAGEPYGGRRGCDGMVVHLSKKKKIDMQECRASFFNRLMRYTISGVMTPPTLAKFTANRNFFLTCVNCEGNREWYFKFSWDWASDYSDMVATWNYCEPCKWKRELYCFQRKLHREMCWI